MKSWHGLVALFLTFAFLIGLGLLSMASQEATSKQEIECIKAGGTIQTFPKACVQADKLTEKD